MKNKSKFVIGFVFLSIVLIGLFSSIPVVRGIDYSDEFEFEPTTLQTEVAKEYDGVDTFFDDIYNTNPIYWYISEGTSCDVFIDQNQHQSSGKQLALYDGNTGAVAHAKYYFPNEMIAETNGGIGAIDTLSVSFWLKMSTASHQAEVRIVNKSGSYYRFWYSNTGRINGHSTWQGNHDLGTYSANVWYYYEFRLSSYTNNILVSIQRDHVYLEAVVYSFPNVNNWQLDYIMLQTSAVIAGAHTQYLDALNYVAYDDWYDNVLDTKLQISGTIAQLDDNYDMIPEGLRYSAISTLFDVYPSEANNYRTYLISDIVDNTDLFQSNRIGRIKGSDTSQNKYKVVQLYFDDLDNNKSFSDSLDHNVNLRINTYDVSDILINYFYINLDFNQTAGLLTWDAFYRESIAIPRWSKEPTNPIFSFSDYLPEGVNVSSLALTIHYRLTANSTNKLMSIRTTVVFNDKIEYIYSYDKIIDAGLLSEFYETQTRIEMDYIDYFNPNTAYDYLNNDNYVYNNLRGYRTLKTNNTGYYYNFLDLGYFMSDLNFYIPPSPEPPVIDEPPEQEGMPEGFDGSWGYNGYRVEVLDIIEVEVGNWTFEFTRLHSARYDAKFYYNLDTVAYLSWTDDWGLIGEWNWLRNACCMMLNILIMIVNGAFIGAQLMLYSFYMAVNFITVYLVIGFIVCGFFWNIGMLALLFACVSLLWLLWLALFGIWLLIQLLYQEVLIPFLEWFLEVGLPLMVDFLVYAIAIILTFMLFCISLGTADWDILYDNIFNMISSIADIFVELFMVFIYNLMYFITFTYLYLIFTGLIYCKYLYTKAKGYNARAEELLSTFQTYMNPIRMFIGLIKTLLGLLPVI